jgi:ubiquinone biosynthesis protein
VRFPAVHWDLTTRSLLTLERMRGLRVTHREALDRAGILPAKVAAALAGAIFQMVMRDGFFHADPHPGNLFVAPDGGLIFVDMGMVGSLTPHMRSNVVDYIVGVVSDDPDLVVDSIMRMGIVRRRGVRTAMRAELESLTQKYGQLPLAQIELGPALRDTMAMARRFEMTFPSDYVVLLKTMSTLEAVARQIDPEATLIGLAAPHADLVMQGRLEPGELLRKTGRDFMEAGRTMIRLPRQISRLLSMMESGEWRFAIDHTGLDPALERLSLIANRLSIAILLASLIIGTALVGRGSTDSLFAHYAIADIGFVSIGAVGLWLVWSILRSRSR